MQPHHSCISTSHQRSRCSRQAEGSSWHAGTSNIQGGKTGANNTEAEISLVHSLFICSSHFSCLRSSIAGAIRSQRRGLWGGFLCCSYDAHMYFRGDTRVTLANTGCSHRVVWVVYSRRLCDYCSVLFRCTQAAFAHCIPLTRFVPVFLQLRRPRKEWLNCSRWRYRMVSIIHTHTVPHTVLCSNPHLFHAAPTKWRHPPPTDPSKTEPSQTPKDGEIQAAAHREANATINQRTLRTRQISLIYWTEWHSL